MSKELKVALFCSGGMSSSLVGSKLQKVYTKEDKDIKVDAYDFGMLDEVGSKLDVIIIAPQISWAYDQVKKDYPNAKVIKLTMQEFGSMSGEVVAKRLEKEGI
ncbi:PTS sugar transporter subunit IIB [Lactobacillus psittaci]|nr:transcription antiterminator [Lactobacillus psittaci]